MQAIPQIAPVTKLQCDHTSIFALLQQGPVILTQRSKPTAVLVSAEEWDRTAHELAQLRRMVKADPEMADVTTDPLYENLFARKEASG
jgi:PHD/YefM family antitoxin component YafN of YafNO toxin-antitoxin module